MSPSKRRTIAFTETVELSTTARRAFWFTVTPDKPADMDPKVDYWQPQELPPRVGTENHFRMRFLGVPLRMASRFVEFDDPRRFVVEGVRPRLSRWARMTNEVEEVASGATRYTVAGEIRYPAWGAPIAVMMATILRRAVRTVLTRSIEIFGGEYVSSEPS